MPILSYTCSRRLGLGLETENVQSKTKVVIFGFRRIEMQSVFHFAEKKCQADDQPNLRSC